jgi:hypothetical protein
MVRYSVAWSEKGLVALVKGPDTRGCEETQLFHPALHEGPYPH